jgi:hypothetical protein
MANLGTVIDTTKASTGRDCVDGVHYSDDVYSVIAQMVANAYTLHFPAYFAKSGKPSANNPKPTGSMSFPTYGGYILLLSFVMLFGMDSFLGIGFLSLKLFGVSLDWEAAYGPLHKKIGVPMTGGGASPHSPSSRLVKDAEAESVALLTEEKITA